MIPEDYQKKLNEFEKCFPNFISKVPYIYDVDINKKMKFNNKFHCYLKKKNGEMRKRKRVEREKKREKIIDF